MMVYYIQIVCYDMSRWVLFERGIGTIIVYGFCKYSLAVCTLPPSNCKIQVNLYCCRCSIQLILKMLRNIGSHFFMIQDVAKKNLKIPKRQSSSVYRRRTDNVMAKRLEAQWAEPVSLMFHSALRKLYIEPSQVPPTKFWFIQLLGFREDF